jgi:hypothetical protein
LASKSQVRGDLPNLNLKIFASHSKVVTRKFPVGCAENMSLDFHSQKSLRTLVAFLNSYSDAPFSLIDLRPLFLVSSVATCLNRLVSVLEGEDCVVGVEELNAFVSLFETETRYEKLTAEECEREGTGLFKTEEDVRYDINECANKDEKSRR